MIDTPPPMKPLELDTPSLLHHAYFHGLSTLGLKTQFYRHLSPTMTFQLYSNATLQHT